MGGYLARAESSKGIHDPLFARALVLDDGAERVAIVTADLAAIDTSLAHSVRRRIESETGIPASHTLIALSHTHSGPLVAPRRLGTPDLSYLESLQNHLAAAARAALESPRPVRIATGSGKVYLGINRRERTPENRIVIGRNPKGYCSPFARILAIADEHAGPIAVLFTYGAHPVILGPDNLEISGDYAGHAERVIEENYGDTAVALFALGLAGDVNANFEHRTFDEVEIFGTALGRAVLEKMKEIDYTTDATLRVRTCHVDLPLQSTPSVDEAERILFRERQRLSGILGHGEDRTEINQRRLMVEWASHLVELASLPDPPTTATLELQGIRIGETAIVAFSAEVFAEYEKILKEMSPFPHTIAISNANGNIGYLPVAAAFDEGGYEVDMAPRLFGALPFRPDVETHVRQGIARLLADLAAEEAPPLP